ncbi:hypothetical protein [Oryzobacter telluris]|jgi:hypothetical protein|uniref:hypothetical protein n=1 Tax=Oryzobacter telluris TaxID=3149179 RepID=UPI00370DDFB5
MTAIVVVLGAVLVLGVTALVGVRADAARRRRARRSRRTGRTAPLTIHTGWLPMMDDPVAAKAPRHARR